MEVDPQFRQSQAAARRRRAQRRFQMSILAGAGLAGMAAVIGLAYWMLAGSGDLDPEFVDASAADDEQITQVEPDAGAPAVRLATPFVDIAGDPMILRFETGDAAPEQRLPGPATLSAARFGPARPDRFSLIVEDLVVRESRLITALPSSREDFAFFQAQRSRSLEAPQGLPRPAVPEGDGETVTVLDDDNSWGDAVGEDAGANPTTYVDTRIQNTTSTAFVRPETDRREVSRDLVVRLERPRALTDFLVSNGFAEDVADAIAKAAEQKLPELSGIIVEDELETGTVIAVRHRRIDDTPTPLQIAIYGPEGYIGALARRGLTGYVVGSNPWIEDDLLARAAPDQADWFGQAQDYRLLDAVYSAVIRNGVPTEIVGEMIVMLSQAYDLEAVAAPGDRVTLLYAPDHGDGPGQIAFAAINGPSGDMPCYVATRQPGKDDFACFTPQGLRGGDGGAFVTPVSGTLSSPFGPRFHPILKEVRLHGGVDWAAPTGTPIVAARDGTFAVVGNGGGYGNVVYIDHAEGLQSRYAHMDSFAPAAVVGKQVRAGDVIGYVGTTGRSTGPHLHFEFRRNGVPIDPFSLGGGGTLAASDAVEALTDQIIRVESAGNANARNPLSTATGLGQFIESTWLRMMRDYRPDLARTMSRADLLALRVDPTLSREMVQNLARENENFLRARGHRVDAGRLYLSHFLGPAGAHKVLSSPDNQTVLAVMGASVVRANPFLTNYTIADLKAWAQRKMRGAATGGSAPHRPAISAEVRAYMAAIDALLSEDT